MNNYEKLKSIIVAEIPEIMELKFGCKFLYSTANKPNGETLILLSNPEPDYNFVDTYSDYFGAYKVEKEFIDGIEIIGRDITLADVLRVIEDKEMYAIMASGEFVEPTPDGMFRTGIYWNFEKLLQGQSNKTIEWLLKLLS